MTTDELYRLRRRLWRNELTEGDRQLLSECMRLVGEKMELRERELADSFDERYPTTDSIFGPAPAACEVGNDG